MTDISLKEIEALRSQEFATKVLQDAIEKLAEDGDSESFLLTLRNLTKVQGGMSALSKRVGINRQNLYRTFAKTGNPKFRSLSTILRGLGYRLSVEPLAASGASKNSAAAASSIAQQDNKKAA